MRDILFKAKRIDNGEWVEGYYAYFDNEHSIIYTRNNCMWIRTIDITTLCQYTGLTDKNGNKIWENDVVECKNDESHFQSQIEWDKSYCGFILQDSDTSAVGLDAITKYGIYKDVQVIGNIFDNPELLGV